MSERMGYANAHRVVVDVEKLIPRGLPQCVIAVFFQPSEQGSWSGGKTHYFSIMEIMGVVLKSFSEVVSFSLGKMNFCRVTRL
jgi:hypothetical protein